MASSYHKERHDIGLVRTNGSTEVGLMLAEKNGVPAYRAIIDKYFPAPRYSTAPDYGSYDPENEIWMTGDDHRAGFGLEIYDTNNPKRYLDSVGCDLRFKDRVIKSYEATAITNPQFSTLAIVNGDMELEATGWTNGVRDGDHKVSGSYGWKVSNFVNAIQVIDASLDTIYRGAVIKVTCAAWTDTASKVLITVLDGDDTTNSSYHTGGSTFETLTVTHKIGDTATKIQLQMFAGTSTDGWFDDFTITYQPVTGAAIKGVDFNSLHYIPIGNTLFKLDGTAAGLTAVYTFPVAITSLAAMTIGGVDYLFIAQGLANAYYYMVVAETVTLSNASNNTMQFMTVYNTTAPTMAGNESNSTIRTTVDPLNAGTAWSDTTQIDKDFYDITGLHTEGGALYIPKEDTVYYLDSSGNVQADLAPELLPLKKSTDNGKNSVFFKDNWYFPWGDQSLLESGTANDFKNPGLYCTNLSAYVGQVFAVTADDMYLWGVVDNSTSVEVMAGRSESIDGTATWVWHPYQTITLTGCNAAWVSSFYRKSLYIASTATDENLYYIPLPIGYGDVDSDTNRDFPTTGTQYFTTPWLHGNFKATPKAFTELTLDMGHTYSANIYWTAEYQVLGDGATWTSIGNFDGASGNMIETLPIPEDSGTNEPVSTMIRFRFTGVTNSSTVTPVLLSYHVKATLYPDVRYIIECVVRSGDNILDKNGVTLRDTDAAYIRTVMAELKDATWPQTFYDKWGASHTVKLLPIEPFSEIVKDEKTRNIEEYYYLRLQETTIHS